MTLTQSSQDYSLQLKTALAAADKAAEKIKGLREASSFSIDLKGARNLVTTADTTAERLIIDAVRDMYPDHAFLAEESANDDSVRNNENLWIIDPVDGTTNFAHRHVHVGISIGYAVNGEVVAGVVNAPFLGEVFHAVKGGGAFCNGKPIKVSSTTSLEDSLIATGFPYDRSEVELIGRRLTAVLRICRDIRRNGAASLDICGVACGRLDGYYESVMPWDCAAANLIAREAGAKLGNFRTTKSEANWPADLDGEDYMVTTPGIFRELREILTAQY